MNEQKKFCHSCGKGIGINTTFCPHCGSNQSNMQSNNQAINTNISGRHCPKCGSNNISFQRETMGTFGGAYTSISKGHGCLYWMFVGWWFWIFKFMWELLKFCCTGGLSLLFKKKKAGAKTISASKNINRTVAVCQNCGHSWKI